MALQTHINDIMMKRYSKARPGHLSTRPRPKIAAFFRLSCLTSAACCSVSACRKKYIKDTRFCECLINTHKMMLVTWNVSQINTQSQTLAPLPGAPQLLCLMHVFKTQVSTTWYHSSALLDWQVSSKGTGAVAPSITVACSPAHRVGTLPCHPHTLNPKPWSHTAGGPQAGGDLRNQSLTCPASQPHPHPLSDSASHSTWDSMHSRCSDDTDEHEHQNRHEAFEHIRKI